MRRRRERRWFVGLPVTGAMVFALLASSAGAAPAGSIWKVVPTPNPGAQKVSNIFFTGVSAASSTDAWAVGIDEINAFRRPLVEHWDGLRWRAVAVPRPPRRQSWFSGVIALSATDAWGVGQTTSPQFNNQKVRTLIEHWDGTNWNVVPSPNPAIGPNDGDQLSGIAGVGPNDLWSVGSEHNDTFNENVLLFEHFDGTSWKLAKTPSPIGAEQFGSAIAAVASNDVWAVGSNELQATLAAHWDGRRWSIVPTHSLQDGISPLNLLTGVTVVATNNVWASGYEGNVNNQNFMKPYVLHWDGTKWTLMLVPNLGGEGSRLNAISALSASDIWGAGQTQELDGSILTFTEQFDANPMDGVPSPDPGQIWGLTVDSLLAVAGFGGRLVFALGTQEMTGHCCQLTLAVKTTQG